MEKIGLVFIKNEHTECIFYIDKLNEEILNNSKSIESPLQISKFLKINIENLLLKILNAKDIKELINIFPDDMANNLNKLPDINNFENIQKDLQRIVDYTFLYKVNEQDYSCNFKDVIVNNISFTNYSKDIDIIFDQKINFLNYNMQPCYDIYIINSLKNLCYISLKMFIEYVNKPIRACKNCKKYFAVKVRKDELFCNNLYLDTGKTCKELASNVILNEKLETDNIYKLYKNIRAKKQMQIIRNPKSIELKQQFDIWNKEAKQKYQLYKNGKLKSTEFENWLNCNNDN